MALEVKCEFKDGIQFAEAYGHYSLESSMSTFSTLIEYIIKNQAKKVFIDCRKIENLSKSIVYNYKYADFIAEKLQKERLSVKIVYLHHSKNKDSSLDFAEDVAFNRGVKGKVFFDYDKALSWLKE